MGSKCHCQTLQVLKVTPCLRLSLLSPLLLVLFLRHKEIPLPIHKILLFLRVFPRHKELSFPKVFPRDEILLFLRAFPRHKNLSFPKVFPRHEILLFLTRKLKMLL